MHIVQHSFILPAARFNPGAWGPPHILSPLSVSRPYHRW